MRPNIQRQEPLPGQESVWDYPRPPRLELSPKRVRVVFNGVTIADTTRAYRVLETSHPPSYYIAPEDVQMQIITRVPRYQTMCEFKGAATYWTLTVGDRVSEQVAWSYANPNRGYEAIRNYLAFYPGRVDACYVGDEQVQAQAGDFYGGWITNEIVGPFKGAAGTRGW